MDVDSTTATTAAATATAAPAQTEFGVERRYQDDDVAALDVLEQLPWEAGPEAQEWEPPPPVAWEHVRPLPQPTAFGVVARHVLSARECALLCDYGQRLGMVPASNRPDYRNCDRAVFRSARLADVLFARIRPLLPARISDAATLHVSESALGLDGVWRAQGLNPVFRIVRYQQGGHFSPHYDGDVALSASLRSFLTLNIYLNETFADGHTEFLSQSVALGAERNPGRPLLSTHVVARVAPVTGAGLIFSHHLLHQGGVVGPGQPKWILRSDVLYEREAGTGAPLSERQQRAQALLGEAIRAELAGRMAEACDKYRAAFRLWPELEAQV